MKLIRLLKSAHVSELMEFRKELDDLIKSKLHGTSKDIIDLYVSVRCLNVCHHNGIKTLDDVSKYSIDEFIKLPNVGMKSVTELTDALNLFKMNWKK